MKDRSRPAPLVAHPNGSSTDERDAIAQNWRTNLGGGQPPRTETDKWAPPGTVTCAEVA